MIFGVCVVAGKSSECATQDAEKGKIQKWANGEYAIFGRSDKKDTSEFFELPNLSTRS